MPPNASTLDQLIARNAELRRRTEELVKELREQESLHREVMAKLWATRESLEYIPAGESDRPA